MTTGKRESLAVFQLEGICELFAGHMKVQVAAKGGRASSGDKPLRLIERHFIRQIPATEKKTKIKEGVMWVHTPKQGGKR
jgi:hypothetical protein